jgi:hypothetical protein
VLPFYQVRPSQKSPPKKDKPTDFVFCFTWEKYYNHILKIKETD